MSASQGASLTEFDMSLGRGANAFKPNDPARVRYRILPDCA
jgi:hypothetical protein